MALTLSGERISVGNKRQWIGSATFDASYLTGGELVTPGDFGLTAIDHIQASAPSIDDEALCSCVWVESTGALMLVDAAGLEEASTTDVSATVVHLTVTGY